jgi:hypothetical protein
MPLAKLTPYEKMFSFWFKNQTTELGKITADDGDFLDLMREITGEETAEAAPEYMPQSGSLAVWLANITKINL